MKSKSRKQSRLIGVDLLIALSVFFGLLLLVIAGFAAFKLTGDSSFLMQFTIIWYALAGLVSFWLAYGLYKRKPWARRLQIALAALGVIRSLLTFQSNIAASIIGIVLGSIILWYLLGNAKVKEAFTPK